MLGLSSKGDSGNWMRWEFQIRDGGRSGLGNDDVVLSTCFHSVTSVHICLHGVMNAWLIGLFFSCVFVIVTFSSILGMMFRN